jgi:hypothetical protein
VGRRVEEGKGAAGWARGGAAVGAGDHNARAVRQRGTEEAVPLTCGPGHSAGHFNPFKSVNSIQMNWILNQTRSNSI